MEDFLQSIGAHNAKLTACLKRFQESGKITDELYTTSVELAQYLSIFIANIENNGIALEE